MTLPFDEVDALIASTRERSEDGKIDTEKLIDEVLDLYITDFVFGTNAAAEMLGVDITPDMDEMQKSIEKKFDGKGFRDRLREYAPANDIEAIVKVIDTDSTRIFNEGILSAAQKAGATKKTWKTMGDERVRDTHRFLEDMTIPIGDRFYTYDGDSALAPGGFLLPQNCVNCRCWIEVR